jgi:hypothetical protein
MVSTAGVHIGRAFVSIVSIFLIVCEAVREKRIHHGVMFLISDAS